jgi:hypothetical protein
VNVVMSADTREVSERRQRVLRAGLEKMGTLRLSGDPDESFYDALRESVLAAGATDADIDALATYVVDSIVEQTADDPENRRLQFELIALHLSCADMIICPGRASTGTSRRSAA